MSIPLDDKKQDFAYRFRTARIHANLTQQALAEKVGISQAAIHKLEAGKFQSSRKTITIAMICGVNPVWLETGEGEMLLDVNRYELSTRPSAAGGGVPVTSTWHEHLDVLEKDLDQTIQSLFSIRERIRRLRVRQRVRPRRDPLREYAP